MYDVILSQSAIKLLGELEKDSLPKGSYLAGGTALALWFGHRKSVDLDFFTSAYFSETQWEQKLKKELKLRITYSDWQTIVGFVGETKFSLFGYKYKLLNELTPWKNICVAGLSDLSAMKFDTVTKRGTRRDFIDIYFLSKKFSLRKLFEFYGKKYGNLEDMRLILKKALLYFNEADEDEMPEMLVDVAWKDVKNYFLSEVKKL
ncbi:MAG: hypothetical protein UU14_C0045G0006 [Candidatus Roizmanbacteria bacterium GW2011_GWB1_40_7]|uniref:Nucleotidyl transferase AbiEii/AbiGii toxin family protein n=1 Tax=Candidatus Roizmanbacteria bacterium GW2011_GWB1_40_7 TaxID=1618482 RepID=A0A0G0T103_9BACT|nr:MAG: hypothetical protein US43_C0021G0022 [Candidatus Levybacteria bacterium GW2011_GWA1_37_16]KKR70743.1 MAG: hypothetical protein UU14_C0045G0006 [Candidatus Roizmanbacteria bacterium GW2011_GWB1_40_7]OGH50519.1 MAG: hypothetical protein A3H17_04290 [Candidatus Levybacteria bacterium RIFCSPLOWO2_12_FULL_37_14]